ncbi:MAG: hypothetical protein GDA68_22440 [Nitrospira sp. CR2.1]|nr:hypothetical protein [Nitrospira sp. CR2.1]
MRIQPELQSRLNALFKPLERRAAGGAIPPIGFLADQLSKCIDRANKTDLCVPLSREVAMAFVTASIDAWLRAVHSFLVSCAITKASPIWASVVGYYSSHYTIRSLAHLLGFFHLYRKKVLARLEVTKSGYICQIERKHAKDREHSSYWKLVKSDIHFVSDPLFTANEAAAFETDVGHRDRATYSDHVSNLPTFKVVEVGELRNRIKLISTIAFDTPSLPRPSRFPDVESVQLVAYHRIVRFRQLLDQGVGTRNRFWSVHRTPGWSSDFINFQLTEQGGLAGTVSGL